MTTNRVDTNVVELAPRRVNALHPAIVGDSPQWRDMPSERFDALVARTPIARLVTMAEVVDASLIGMVCGEAKAPFGSMSQRMS